MPKEENKVILLDVARKLFHPCTSLCVNLEVKVAQVKWAVKNGTYEVAGVKVAAGMLRESFENGLLLQEIAARTVSRK